MSTSSTATKMHELVGRLLDRDDAAVSPLSIQLCLAMLLAGARNDTHVQLCAFLGVDPEHEHDFLTASRRLRDELTAELASVQVDMASALFCAGGVKPAYKSLCAERLDAEVRPLASGTAINAWVAERTKGMISEVLTEDPHGPLVLVQALVFAAKFLYRFDPADTKPAMFDCHRPAGESDPLPVQMMTMTASLRYTGDNGVQVVELPYGTPGDSSFVAYVFLPRGQRDLRSIVQRLIADREVFDEIVDCLEDTDVQLSLPKFSLDSAASIADALKAMGVEAAFDAAADFGRITDEDAFVQDVLHAVRLEVNEKGTKAAAATAAILTTRGGGGRRKDPVVMTVSSPFAFVVAHPATKTLLFAAVVSNPVA